MSSEGGLRVGSLFSGIGGLDLGLERAGMRVVWQCELDPYCRRVLRHHWPDVPCYEDIRAIDGSAPAVDVLCGGFPCQPVSLAGQRKGTEDERWLWPEFARLVGELRPKYVLVENVPGLASKGLGLVLGSLSEMGYDAEWQVVSAASVGAPHLRERLFVVAYPGGERRQQVAGSARSDEGANGRRAPEDHVAPGHGEGNRPGQVPGDVAHPHGQAGNGERPAGQAVYRPEAVERLGRRCSAFREQWAVEPDVGRVAHGVPERVDRLRALGNAVVPQVAQFVGELIVDAEARS